MGDRRQGSSPGTLGPGTVLIIDDDAELRYLLCRVVQRLGLQPLEAGDGQHGLDLYHRHQDAIVCVIIDQYMPVLGGSATLRALRALSPTLPVVLVSGFGYGRDDEHRRDPHTVEIEKPFTIRELSAALGALIKPGPDQAT